MINLIVAMDRNRAIGAGGKMPWHLPADLKRFKSITMGHPVIMGRKTWESIGKPLPGRTNIIVTRNRDYRADGCTVVNSLDEALKNGDVFVIGGGEIYKLALPLAGKAYVTEVDTRVEGADTFFPELGPDWRLVEEEDREPDDKNPFALRYLTYLRER